RIPVISKLALVLDIYSSLSLIWRYSYCLEFQGATSHDRFIVAASPVYLQAVEEDLYAGRDELASPEQMTIVTSKGYQGCLGNNVTLTSAAMMSELNTNMTGLNISHAVKILKMQEERATRNAA
ncbi:hypothetical protein ACOTXM_23970, partial [Enterobacter cloacae complex sp. IR5457]